MPTITARYTSRCDRCSADIGRGDTIGYEKPRAWCGPCWRVVEGRRADLARAVEQARIAALRDKPDD